MTSNQSPHQLELGRSCAHEAVKLVSSRRSTSNPDVANELKTLDDLFRQAVPLIRDGDLLALETLLAAHPQLATSRLESPGPWLVEKIAGPLGSFFARPYLLWFVSEDAVIYGTLPSNIAAIAAAIIRAAKQTGTANLPEQLDYALSLVAWSGVAAKCDVQIDLLDTLIDAGADPNRGPDEALVNGHRAAAEHLLARGANPTLGSAFCLGRWDDAERLFAESTDRARRFAFVLAALNGRADALRRMIALGCDVNAPSEDLYSHGTPLHHAVASGQLAAVQLLVEAGTHLAAVDTAWQGTPLGWAEHYIAESTGDGHVKQYPEIAAYLKSQSGFAR